MRKHILDTANCFSFKDFSIWQLPWQRYKENETVELATGSEGWPCHETNCLISRVSIQHGWLTFKLQILQYILWQVAIPKLGQAIKTHWLDLTARKKVIFKISLYPTGGPSWSFGFLCINPASNICFCKVKTARTRQVLILCMCWKWQYCPLGKPNIHNLHSSATSAVLPFKAKFVLRTTSYPRWYFRRHSCFSSLEGYKSCCCSLLLVSTSPTRL